MPEDLVRTTILAFIQGITEFLPISSSAHLILPSALLGWSDQGLAFDVAVHLGTLAAVVFYLRRDILSILAGLTTAVLHGEQSHHSRLGMALIIATLPVLIAGLLLGELVKQHFRNTGVIAFTTILFALLLYRADRVSKNSTRCGELSWRAALFIGLAQALALVPGTSRSGVTMTAALFCNMDRLEASRFSFLLAIPVISRAAILMTLNLLRQESVDWIELAYATAVSGLVAFLCIHTFLKFINRIGFLPFVIYRLLLGFGLIVFIILG